MKILTGERIMMVCRANGHAKTDMGDLIDTKLKLLLSYKNNSYPIVPEAKKVMAKKLGLLYVRLKEVAGSHLLVEK